MFHWLLWGITICLHGISKRQSADNRSFMKVSEFQKAAMQSCWLWLCDAGVTSGKCCSTKRVQRSTLRKTFKNFLQLKPGEIQRKLFSGWESKSFFTLLPIAQCTWRQPQEIPAQRSTQRLSETPPPPPRVLCSSVMLIRKAALSGEVKLHASNKQNQKPTYHKNHF